MGHGFDYEVDEERGGCLTSFEERKMFPPGSPCEKSCKIAAAEQSEKNQTQPSCEKAVQS